MLYIIFVYAYYLFVYNILNELFLINYEIRRKTNTLSKSHIEIGLNCVKLNINRRIQLVNPMSTDGLLAVTTSFVVNVPRPTSPWTRVCKRKSCRKKNTRICTKIIIIIRVYYIERNKQECTCVLIHGICIKVIARKRIDIGK